MVIQVSILFNILQETNIAIASDQWDENYADPCGDKMFGI